MKRGQILQDVCFRMAMQQRLPLDEVRLQCIRMKLRTFLPCFVCADVFQLSTSDLCFTVLKFIPLLADEECCAQLDEINFSSNLPVVIVDTMGVTPNRNKDKIPAILCTCGSPKHGDYAGNVTFNIRGGVDSRELSSSSSTVFLT